MKKMMIGIDPGVITGIGYFNSQGGKSCFSTKIHRAMDWVKEQHKNYDKIFIRVEYALKEMDKTAKKVESLNKTFKKYFKSL